MWVTEIEFRLSFASYVFKIVDNMLPSVGSLQQEESWSEDEFRCLNIYLMNFIG